MEVKEGFLPKIRNYFGVSSLFKAFIGPLIISLIFSFTFMYFFEITIVDGVSMEGTLHDSDKLLVSKKSYSDSIPKYKDIIIIKHKTDIHDFIVKRVIGLPGQTIEIKNNEVFIDGNKLEEDYIKEEIKNCSDMIVKIPENTVFVMGDNRNNSGDSRDIGVIPIEKIEGKVVFSLWPFNNVN
ncbi:MAG: signal peptidase I [Clostridium sp.]